MQVCTRAQTNARPLSGMLIGIGIGSMLADGTAPRLVEYTVCLTQSLAPIIAESFPCEAKSLSSTVQSNKLACCLGGGSNYDKHIDNLGAGDSRKLTVLYYLNREDWDDDGSTRGGSFRAYLGSSGATNVRSSSVQEPCVDVACRGDRLLGFWSDSLVHEVLPSFAPGGPSDYR